MHYRRDPVDKLAAVVWTVIIVVCLAMLAGIGFGIHELVSRLTDGPKVSCTKPVVVTTPNGAISTQRCTTLR